MQSLLCLFILQLYPRTLSSGCYLLFIWCLFLFQLVLFVLYPVLLFHTSISVLTLLRCMFPLGDVFLFLSSCTYVVLSACYFFDLTILFLLLFVFLVVFNYFLNSFYLVVFYILLYIGKLSGSLFPDRAWTAKITQSCFLVNLHNLVFLC